MTGCLVRGQDDNNVDDEDQTRYFKDDSFKPAIFGSSAYDPIKEVFEPLKHQAHTTTESEAAAANHTGGSTVGQPEPEETHAPPSTTHDAGRARDPFFRQHGNLVSKMVLQNFSTLVTKAGMSSTEMSRYLKQRVPIKVIKLD